MKSLLFFITTNALLCLTISLSKATRYNAIFSFGDSISDTGNSILTGYLTPFGKLPYGESFPGGPTGRCSDGRLIIDFIAEALGLPYLPPYLSHTHHSGGVNFAVAGATALAPEFFYRWGIVPGVHANYSLSLQLDWFKELKQSLCATRPDCDQYLKKSIFLVGEICGNDYGLVISSGRTIQQLEAFVPLVVEAIINTTIALIEEGAAELVLPAHFPVGCWPVYLNRFRSRNETDYDSLGCLKAFNAFSKSHNSRLKASLETLRTKYPHARIVYADYYGASMRYYQAPQHYGLNKETLFTACCGAGGPNNYNFDPAELCGGGRATTCKDPSSYASWDGVHLTEAAYRIIADGLLNGPFTTPPLFNRPSSLRDFI